MIFVDSSFIIALINENDSLHEKAFELIDIIENEKLVISNLIINEVITVIGNKIDLNTAIKSFDLINSRFDVIEEYNIKNFNFKCMNEYEKYNTKLSFTDSSIIVVSKEFAIEKIVTFDKEFKKVMDVELIGI